MKNRMAKICWRLFEVGVLLVLIGGVSVFSADSDLISISNEMVRVFSYILFAGMGFIVLSGALLFFAVIRVKE